MTGALAGIKVIDLSDTVAGQYCSRLLSDYGADVWIVESGEGTCMRRAAPMSKQGDSLLFRHLNAGKYSLRVDVDASGELALPPSIFSSADVVIYADGKKYSHLAGEHTRSIFVHVSDFGDDGPYAGWQGPEIVLQALSGMMHNNGTYGREPLFGVGDRASYAAGIAAYVGVLVALYERLRSGRGQLVSVDSAETAAAMCYPYPLRYLYNGKESSRSDQVVPAGLIQCRNGWVCIWIYDHLWSAIVAALDLPELEQDVRFADPAIRRQNWSELVAIIQKKLADDDAERLVDHLQSRQIIAAKSYRPSEQRQNAHLAARSYWEEVSGRTILGAPFRLSRTPRQLRSAGPALGEGRDFFKQDASLHDLSSVKQSSQIGSAPPLNDLRVVELTTAWAGPMAGRVLAYFGAESIHVEAPNRVNSWRLTREGVNTANYPDRDPGARPFDRAFLFNSQNINKRSCVLDLKTEEGRAALRALLGVSDVLICNFRPGTLARLGLDYTSLTKIKPDIIVAELPAFGTFGPMAGYAALGPTMEMATGMAALIGYRDGKPETTGPSYLDPIGGFNACAAILTALLYRQRTGEGQYVEVPQVEAAMHLIGAELLAAFETGEDPPRNGNRVEYAAPHDAYPALGEDQWVVIAAQNDQQFAALCVAMDRSALAVDPRYKSAARRIENADMLDIEISAWTRSRHKNLIAQELQRLGVAAAPVATAKDTVESEYLAARGFFTDLVHPETGKHSYPGIPIKLGRSPGKQVKAAPTFGEDNRYVLESILRMEDRDMAKLSVAMSTKPLPGA